MHSFAFLYFYDILKLARISQKLWLGLTERQGNARPSSVL